MTRSTRGDPQIEDGFLRIANELAEAFARTKLSPNESRCVWFIIRMTYGYNRKSARISRKQWATTGIDPSTVYKVLATLEARNIIKWIQVGGKASPKRNRKIMIQKHYKKWKQGVGRDLRGRYRSLQGVGHDPSLPIISERQLKDRGKLCHCGKTKKEEWHKVCDECYSNPQIMPDRYANLPDCPNCTTKSFSQNINLEVGGCNFCKPMEVE